jgi:hydrogenase/urease accessory protein HupE
MVMLFGAWLIYEEFTSVREIYQLAGGFFISTLLASICSLNVERMLQKRNLLFSRISGLIVLFAGMYLTIYYVYVHYLIAVKL